MEMFCIPSVDLLKDFVAQHGLIDMAYLEIIYVIQHQNEIKHVMTRSDYRVPTIMLYGSVTHRSQHPQ